ncbi:carbohydrate kinase family protein [Methylobacterium nonmethylotrophicum]|uniref:Carbohydrate kinase n=1 Tax=Methylobacterium nonmethylotrophicum TaxID=1141884 RepID=A0A4Z0NGV8_9HYPH|nr:carbohydrate kinase [Methylobacterium nonmethylotrophicum]TGD95456.1 carbohydrate kinase [Methylobacterium nonmethylotrophicum]
MILVCGEALIDLFVETVRPSPERAGLPALAVAGGSPFNLAIGLSRLGATSGFLGGLSGDAFGRMLADRLTAEGVDLAFARESARPTPLAIVSTGPDGHPAYTFHAEACAHADLTTADLPATLPDAVEAIALGSFSLVAEPVGTAYAALAAREARRRVISLDPNLRLGLIPDLQRWHARFDDLVAHADIVKLSDEDLRAAYGAGADEGEIARAWLDAGVALVVVTAGPDGARAYRAGGSLAVPGRTVAVIDTVGAGDTFHAALLARLDRDGRLSRDAILGLGPEALAEILAEAVAAASLTCTRLGADLPTLAALRALTP